MSVLPEKVSRVQDLVERAFAHVPRPSRITKRVAVALDDEWTPDEDRCRELIAEDREQHWRELTDADIEEFCTILPWLDDEGLRFYLPAFMSYALRRFPSEGHRAISDVHDLCGGSKWRSALTSDQIAAVREFEALYGYLA